MIVLGEGATTIREMLECHAERSPAGLVEVTLRADPAHRAAIIARAGSDRLADPWGTRFVVAE